MIRTICAASCFALSGLNIAIYFMFDNPVSLIGAGWCFGCGIINCCMGRGK